MTAAEPHAHRDPILDPPRKKKKGLSTGAIIGIGVSVVVHALVGIYLYQNKFKLKEFNYVDDSVDVELVELPPPVYIEPTKKDERQEYTGPPVVVPGPPPPPAPPAPPAAPPRQAVTTNVSWGRRPAPEFPQRAQDRGIEAGSVTLLCTVGANGSASNCSVVSETPSGAGFGQEALRSMRSARFSPSTVDGVAQGGQARFTVRFQLQ